MNISNVHTDSNILQYFSRWNSDPALEEYQFFIPKLDIYRNCWLNVDSYLLIMHTTAYDSPYAKVPFMQSP